VLAGVDWIGGVDVGYVYGPSLIAVKLEKGKNRLRFNFKSIYIIKNRCGQPSPESQAGKNKKSICFLLGKLEKRNGEGSPRTTTE